MARTFHHTPDARLIAAVNRQEGRTASNRHSAGVSLAARAAGAHFYRDEVDADGGKPALRRRVRRTGRHAFRQEVAGFLR